MKNLILISTFAIFFNFTTCLNDKRLDDAFTELPNYQKQPKKVEFIEDISGEPYLDDISFDDRYYLDLLRFQNQLKDKMFKVDENKNYFCNYDILTAMGLKGYANPIWKTDDIVDCPAMTFNCCSPVEFGNLDDIWKKFSKYIELHHYYYAYYIKEILKHHQDYMEVIDEVRGNTKYRICKKAATLLKDMVIDNKTLKDVDKMIDKVQKFDMHIKKGFKCLLCDFNNAKYVDKEHRYIKFHTNVCSDMIKHNFEYYYHFNNFIWKYINTVNLMAHCVNHADTTHENQFVMNAEHKFDFLPIDNSLYLENCKLTISSKGTIEEIFQSCVNFCYRFELFDYSTNIFKDINVLGRMFKNIKAHLIKSDLLEVSEPAEELKKFRFEFLKPELNIFNFFQYI